MDVFTVYIDSKHSCLQHCTVHPDKSDSVVAEKL